MSNDYLFVYGTLKTEGNHPLGRLLKSSARFVGKAVFQGKLYLINDYPGAVSSDNPGDVVYGEVYLLGNRKGILSQLDQYEETGAGFPEPTEYVRQKKNVRLESGESLEAWIYLYNRATEKLQAIDSGHFTRKRDEIIL